jgi:hypothetical protein
MAWRTVIAAFTFAGCAVPVVHDKEETSSVSSAVVTANWQNSDNTLQVTLVQCDWSASSSTPSASCFVPAGYVLVGGGAEIEGESQIYGAGPNPGALLTWSTPNNDLTAWWAVSKDHLYSYPHRIRAYALGMRVGPGNGTFISEAQLRSQMYIYWTQDTLQTGPHFWGAYINSSPNYQPGDLVVGGGAYVSYSGAGQLLTASFPVWGGEGNTPIGWYARSKDHGISSAGRLTVGMIAMRHCVVGARCFFSTAIRGGAAPTQTGYWTASQGSANGVLLPLTSIGAYGESSNGNGRLLTALVPDPGDGDGGGFMTNKDHGWVDQGAYLWPYAIYTF